MEAVETGVLDIAYTSLAYNVSKIPAGSLVQTKIGGMNGLQMFEWYFEGGGQELVERASEAGGFTNKILFPFIPTTAEVWCHSTKPIRTADDIKGLKMRTAGDGGTVLTRMGASVIMLPGGEVYESMQRGVIDAFEYSTIDTNWTQSFQEVADYMYISTSRAPTDGPPIVINRGKWNGLPAEFQQILQDAWKATGFENYAFQRAADIVALQNFRDYGVTVEKLPADVEREMLEVANEYYAEMSAKDPLYGEIVASQDAFFEAIKTYDAYVTPQY